MVCFSSASCTTCGSSPSLSKRRLTIPALCGLLLGKYVSAREKGVELAFDPACQLLRIPPAISETELMSVIGNLLDNAVRYSPQGSVVDVTLNADNFIVRDNGPGVTPEALARIGERFYRPPGQTATGSGLGLSIVQRIAKLHGMNVEFGNAEQGGFEAKVSW